jgi:ABC-type phosphate transport system permease subunit
MRKLTVHLDAAAIIALIFLASLGMNAWQFLHNRELMQKYVEAEWELGNTRANVVYARKLLKSCDPDKYANLDVTP